ncbi:hypothetical protein V6Z12_D01G083300 [Gossypium hirsutum]
MGKVVRIDERTMNASRGRFARMAVLIDLTKPLITRIRVNGKIKVVEYESLHIDNFPRLVVDPKKSNGATASAESFRTVPTLVKEDLAEKEAYGPWILVEPRKRLQPKQGNSYIFGEIQGNRINGSRFNILAKNRDGSQIAEQGKNQGEEKRKKSEEKKERKSQKDRARNMGEEKRVISGSKKGKEPIQEFKNPFSGMNLKAFSVKKGVKFGQCSNGPPGFPQKEIGDNGPGQEIVGLAINNQAKDVEPNAAESVAQTEPSKQADPPDPTQTKSPPDESISLTNNSSNSSDLNKISISNPLELNNLSKFDDVMTEAETLNFTRSHRVETHGRAGGIWNHFQFIHCRVRKGSVTEWAYITFVYGSPQRSSRKLLWEELDLIATNLSEPWLKGAADSNIGGDSGFQKFVLSAGLRDMGYRGSQFTWSRENLFKRLDRALCNSAWDQVFSSATIFHLPKLRSDHRLLLITIGKGCRDLHNHPFRFFSGWLSHADFTTFVRDNWMTDRSAPHRKKRIIARIKGAQKALESHRTISLISLDIDLCVELEEILDYEELLWKHKSRDAWISHGDRNTSYFHRKTLARRKRNKIETLKLDGVSWCFDKDRLQQATLKYFADLYTADNSATDRSYSRGGFPLLSSADINALKAPIHDAEIREALFSMAPLKAPGVDGFHALFF